MHIYTYICWIHTDAMIKTQEDFFIKICTSNFIASIRKGYSRFVCERELETEHNCNILTPTLMAVNVVSFSFSWCSIGGLGVHSAGCWLSLLHLISNYVSLWEYHGIFYLVPFCLSISAHAISSPNCHWNVSLPSGASPWMAFLAGSKVKIQQSPFIFLQIYRGTNVTLFLVKLSLLFLIICL